MEIRNNIWNLKNKEYLLFSDEDLSPRQNAERDEVVKAFTPLASIIVSNILEADNEYLELANNFPIARRAHTFPSSVLHGFILNGLSNVEGVRLVKFRRRHYFLEVGSYKVWIKKLDNRGLPSVNRTKSSLKRINQKADGDDVMPMLILGFQLDYLERISKIQLMYMSGDQQLWAPIDLGDMAASKIIVPVTVAPADDELDIKVKPGKKKGKKSVDL